MAVQCLIGTWQFVQYRLQDALVLWRGDELTVVIDDAYHEPPTQALLRLDDIPQGVAERDEREAIGYDADQLTAGSAHRFSDDDPRVEGRFSRNAYLEDRTGGYEGPLDDVGRREFSP